MRLQEIRELMEKANQVQSSLQEVTAKLNDTYEYYKFANSMQDGILTWDEIAKYPIGSELELPSTYGSSISSLKTYQSDKEMRFVVTFNDYSVLIRHNHPDIDETIYVATPSTFKVLVGDGAGEFILKYGSTLPIPAGVDHQVTHRGKGEGILEVVFKKVL